MKEQHCYLIKPEKAVMANKKKKLHQQFRNRQCVTSSVSGDRAGMLDGDRQEGRLSGLAQKQSCCRPAHSVSSPGHPTITAIQQSWNMSPGSSGRSAICGKQLLPCLQALQKPNQPTHTHTPSQTCLSIPHCSQSFPTGRSQRGKALQHMHIQTAKIESRHAFLRKNNGQKLQIYDRHGREKLWKRWLNYSSLDEIQNNSFVTKQSAENHCRLSVELLAKLLLSFKSIHC